MYKQQRDKNNEGFYHIHNHKKFSVSKLGTVLYSETGNVLNKYYDEDMELYMVDTSEYGVILPPVHCILAETFVKEPLAIVAVDRFFKRVRFLDGNIHNLNINNLEWGLTEKGLLQKKELNKLATKRPKGTPIVTKDVESGEIIKYSSITDLAEEVDISLQRIKAYLLTPPLSIIKVINNRLVKYDNGSPWPTITKNTKVEEFNSCKRSPPIKTLVFFKNGGKQVFDSIRAAATGLGLVESTIGVQLKRNEGKLTVLTSGDKIQYLTE